MGDVIGKIKELIEKHWEILVYLVFGVLTTGVNWLVYLPLYKWAGFSATFSSAVAWVFAVAFAFLTNKPFVFKSHDWSVGTVVPELIKFLGCRVGSGFAELGILFVCTDLLCWDGIVMKIATSVLVVLVNYIGSKLMVFRK